MPSRAQLMAAASAASRCESATYPACRCWCGGAAHGGRHYAGGDEPAVVESCPVCLHLKHHGRCSWRGCDCVVLYAEPDDVISTDVDREISTEA